MLLVTVICSVAQSPLLPTKGDPGVPGLVPGSFVVTWSPAPNAVGYQYLITDNELCYENCPGDTRMGITSGTKAVEFDLRAGRNYYWTIRAIFASEDTGRWALNSYFVAETPPITPILTTFTSSGVLYARIDWGAISGITEINLSIQGLHGNTVYPNVQQVSLSGVSQRVQLIPLNRNLLRPGMYIIWAEISLRNQETLFRQVKCVYSP